MRKSGALRGQALIAFELVTQFPGRTSKELAGLKVEYVDVDGDGLAVLTVGALDRYQLARRLPELLSMRKVRREEIGNQDCKWWAV